MKILYLVPNLADTAVARRIDMLRLGGAEVSVVGFRRADTAKPDLDVAHYIELGETFDAKFAQRLLAVFRAHRSSAQWIAPLAVPDVIVARNLEMLSLAAHLQSAWPNTPSIVYECLDIHRLMLRDDLIGHAMRRAEQHWSSKAALLLTSSPAFTRNYFDVHGALPAMLLENKVFAGAGQRGRNPALSGRSEPLRIGWFGALRCSKSLQALAEFAASMNGKVEIVLRGRPARSEFDDFDGFVQRQQFMHFAGPYKNPDDLAEIYSDVHLAWAIDFFEEGKNSSWLLPNRIYEGGMHSAIPITLAGTETAAFTARHGIGIVLPDITQASLHQALGSLHDDTVAALANAVAAVPVGAFAFDKADCIALVDRLGQLRGMDSILTEAA